MATERLDAVKAILEILKQALIVMVILAAIIVAVSYRGDVVAYLRNSEIQEFSIAGLKFVVKQKETLIDSDQLIAGLVKLVEQTPALAANHELMSEIENLRSRNKQALFQAKEAESAVLAASPASALLVQGPQSGGTLPDDSTAQKWGIIFGSYPLSVSPAGDLQKAESLETGAVKLFEHKGRRRGVIVFDSQLEARAALPKVAEIFGTDSYIRPLNEWCGDAARENVEVVRCDN